MNIEREIMTLHEKAPCLGDWIAAAYAAAQRIRSLQEQRAALLRVQAIQARGMTRLAEERNELQRILRQRTGGE